MEGSFLSQVVLPIALFFIMLGMGLSLTLDETTHELAGGDCLRYHLSGPTRFETGALKGARYILVLL